MIEKLDHLPELHESVVSDDGIRLIVDEIVKNRINKIHLYLPSASSDKENDNYSEPIS